MHFECRISARLGPGLGGRESPNNIVQTKFRSQDESGKKIQSSIGVIKTDKDNIETKMDCSL